jgi:hypothetical protein
LHGDIPARGTVLVTKLVYGTVGAFAVVQAWGLVGAEVDAW